MPAEIDPFLGRPEALAGVDDVPCKANWLAARRRYVEEQYGRAGVDDVLSRLVDAEVRQAFLTPPLPMSWTRVGYVVAIDRAIHDGPMGGSLGRMRHFGGEIAKYDVGGIYRAFFRLSTPAFVFARIGVVWSMYFRRGAMRCVAREGEAEIHLEGLTMPAYLCSHGIPGWFDAMLELVGARSPSVRHVQCAHAGADHCAWTARWLTRAAART